MTWVEVSRPDGSRYGLLYGKDPDQSVRVRHIEASFRGRRAWCLPVSVRSKLCDQPPPIDWNALVRERWSPDPDVDREWMSWGQEHLIFELLEPDLDPADTMRLLGPLGLRDLFVAALAGAPVMQRVLQPETPTSGTPGRT